MSGTFNLSYEIVRSGSTKVDARCLGEAITKAKKALKKLCKPGECIRMTAAVFPMSNEKEIF